MLIPGKKPSGLRSSFKIPTSVCRTPKSNEVVLIPEYKLRSLLRPVAPETEVKGNGATIPGILTNGPPAETARLFSPFSKGLTILVGAQDDTSIKKNSNSFFTEELLRKSL